MAKQCCFTTSSKGSAARQAAAAREKKKATDGTPGTQRKVVTWKRPY